MWNEDGLYFDYIEIRRRIERRLVSGVGLIVHCVLFMLALVGLIAIFGQGYYYGSSLLAWLNLLMTGWSGVLLLHSVWVYRHVGSSAERRLDALQVEMNERIEADDTDLLASPRQAFRVQSLLDEDIRQRAGWVPALAFALLMNSFLWGITLVTSPASGAIWRVVLMLSVVWLPATYSVNRIRRMRRDTKLRRTLYTRRVDQAPSSKRKPSFDDELERYGRLSDDGELIDLPDEWSRPERKLKRE